MPRSPKHERVAARALSVFNAATAGLEKANALIDDQFVANGDAIVALEDRIAGLENDIDFLVDANFDLEGMRRLNLHTIGKIREALS